MKGVLNFIQINFRGNVILATTVMIKTTLKYKDFNPEYNSTFITVSYCTQMILLDSEDIELSYYAKLKF